MFLRLSTATDLFYVEDATYLLRREHVSLTKSPKRLTGLRASGKLAALRDPLLAPFRRELRWALRSTFKGLAANNLLAGHRARAAWFALRAFLMDPREIAEGAIFLRLLGSADRAALPTRLAKYTKAELDRAQLRG